MSAQSSNASARQGGTPIAILGLLAFLILMPVTLPVTVLRGLVFERFGVSESLASLFMSVNMVGAFVAAPLAGALADRIGRRRQLVIAALLADGVLLFALTRAASFELFMGLRLLEGAAHIAALSLLMGLAARSQSAARRGRVMGMVGGGLTLGVALGAPVGGFLGRDDPILPLLVGSGLVGVAAAVAWLGLRDAPEESDEHSPSLAKILSVLRANRLMLAPLAFAFADRFTVGFYTTTFSFYLSRVHELSPARIGLLMAAFMLPFAVCSYPFGRFAERHSRVAMISIGSLLYGVGTASVPWWPREMLPAIMVLLGVASAVMFVPSLVITTDAAPEEIRTTALGAFNAAGSLGFILGPATGGLVSQWVASQSSWESGYRAAFGVAGASELLCVALALPFLIRLVRAGKTT